MTATPPKWSRENLTFDATKAASLFRDERLAATKAWEPHYVAARKKFEGLFAKLDNLDPSKITDAALADAFGEKFGEALRYLSGPPVSDDDLLVLSEVTSVAPGVLKKNLSEVRKVYSVIEKTIDRYRFPWVAEKRAPTEAERESALVASAVLLAAQRLATERRNDAKVQQEEQVKVYLTKLGFAEVPAKPISTLVNGPQAMQFCGECQLGARKADIVVRLHDTRLLPIECKVSNSSTNSVKRLNNDAAVKAEYWLKQFGMLQVVPSAMLSGVFKVLNLEQAQDRGLALFWAHDLQKLGEFIKATEAQP